MNITFKQMDGKTKRSPRAKITQLLHNLVVQAGLAKDNVISISVSTGRYKTDLPTDSNGVQVRSHSQAEVALTIRLNKLLFGATINFKDGVASRFIEFMQTKNEARTQMPLMTGDLLFTKPASSPHPRPACTAVAPSAPSAKPTKPTNPSKPVSATFNLKKDGISIAFMAVTDALDAPDRPFQKEEAFEWLVDAKIGIPNNRMAGRIITAMMRAGVIQQEMKTGMYTLTSLGEKISQGTSEFPEVPPEKRERKNKVSTNDEPEVKSKPEQVQDEPEPIDGGDQNPIQTLAEPQTNKPEDSGADLEDCLKGFMSALKEEFEARRAYHDAVHKSIQIRISLARHLSDKTIAEMENLSRRF